MEWGQRDSGGTLEPLVDEGMSPMWHRAPQHTHDQGGVNGLLR